MYSYVWWQRDAKNEYTTETNVNRVRLFQCKSSNASQIVGKYSQLNKAIHRAQQK